MKVNNVFLSVNAKDFSRVSNWWSTLLERKWDREPMPSCHEWDLAGCVFFQVLDNSEASGTTTVTLHVADLGDQVNRLRRNGVEVPDPIKVEGFETLRYCHFNDPEGNEVGMLEGA